MSEAPLRVGVVGINERIRRVIIRGLVASPRARVTAVCSRSPEKARETAAAIGAEPLTDYAAMLRSGSVDAVFIATPPALHRPMALAAAAAGCHIICEKPLALTLAEAQEMLQAARAAGVRTAVNFTYRSLGGHRFFAELLAGGLIGQLHDFSLGFWQGRWLLQPSGVDAAMEVGVHLVDLLLWWSELVAAGPVEAVCAWETALDPTAPRPIWHCLVRLAGGASGVLHCDRAAAGWRNGMTVRFYGRAGGLALDFDTDRVVVQRAVPGGQWQPLDLPARLALGYEEFPAYHLDRLVRAIRGEEAFPDFAVAVRGQAVLEAAALSAREGRWVPVPAVG